MSPGPMGPKVPYYTVSTRVPVVRPRRSPVSFLPGGGQSSTPCSDQRVRPSVAIFRTLRTYTGITSTWRCKQKRPNARNIRFPEWAWGLAASTQHITFWLSVRKIMLSGPFLGHFKMSMVAAVSSHSRMRKGPIASGRSNDGNSSVPDRGNSRPP